VFSPIDIGLVYADQREWLLLFSARVAQSLALALYSPLRRLISKVDDQSLSFGAR
jgi:hypothetical protein